MTVDISESPVIRRPPVFSSPLDPRSFRAITLQNNLDVLIVTDSTSDKAAASMDVSVGSFSDPDNLPGLAHFLEHMLFLGTAKYPDEASYNNFLAENGGYSNAFTASENTNYHFQMVVADKNVDQSSNQPGSMPKFKEALDRFSQFFTAPLFTEAATDRELNAVDSEHQKNLQSDSRRIYQTKKTAVNNHHPLYKFSTGSKETLGDTPKDEGLDTRAALLEFHKNYYSANLMKLCISGPHDLDTMEAWVAELFSEIPNTDRTHPCELYRDIPPLLEEHKGVMFHIETIKDIRQLEISWVTAPFRNDFHSKPMTYVINLIGDEGEGSFLSYLKKRGWCNSLGVNINDRMTFSVLHIIATLTSEGVDHIDEILCLLYQYIRMLRETGVQEWLFREEQALAETGFRFMEKHEPFAFTTNISSEMHKYPPEEYLSGSYLYKEYDPEKINTVLDALTPENGIVVVAGKFVAEKTTMTEKWYKTKYHLEKIDESKLDRWRNADVHEEFHIPAVNPFVPTEFKLVGEPVSDGKRDSEGPKLVLKNEHFEVHHKLDRTFEKPKAAIFLHLCSPLVYRSPYYVVMSNLLTCLLEDELTEFSYPAEKAGFDYHLDQATTGITLLIRGYSHRIDVLLDAIISKIMTYVVDPVRFEMQRDAIERNYANFYKGQPYSLAMYNSTQLLEDPRWHIDDYLKRIRDGSITIESLQAYLKAFRERLFITALISGNVEEKRAIEIVQKVQSKIAYTALPEAERLQRRMVQIPTDVDVYSRCKHMNPEDNNSAIEVFYQTGPNGNYIHDATLELLSKILKKPAFHELRTVQQLGYIVFEGLSNSHGKKGLFLIVQSTIADPDVLLDRIDSFLKESRDTLLADMTQETFKQYVSSLVADKAEPDNNLFTQAHRFWREIDFQLFEYNRKENESEALHHVTKEDVIKLFDTFIAKGGSKRRRVVSQVYGNQHPYEERRSLSQDAMEVSSAVKFRRQNPLYPVMGANKQ